MLDGPNTMEICMCLVVCLKVLNEMPVFHKIHRVVLKDERLLLCTFALRTLYG